MAQPRPDPGVVRWFDQVDEDRTYLSVITLGEIRQGIDRLTDERRRQRLDHWLTTELPERFTNRILPIDHTVANQWGRLLARTETAGTTIHGTALTHQLQIITRNVARFRPAGIDVLSPWQN
ncbi:MAG TPA: type II toxin-antitoxin system VapC family toxin [Pseudonocardiaceae bacterium]|nr:type II toxin-antitoxin system VapC family toxin [Pseudonocardiaceae bacterium]